MGIVSQERMKKDNANAYAAEKEQLKREMSKDMSLKKLRKIRADHLNRVQGQREKLGEFLRP